MTPIAAKVMAPAPFGHAVTIQKSSAAPITTKARAALTSEGSQSAMRRARWPRLRETARAGSATSNASPLRACEIPASHFSRLIGEQTQRRCTRRQDDQPPHRRIAYPKQARRVSDPTCRLVLFSLEAKFFRYCRHRGSRLLRRPLDRQSREHNCHRPPGGQGRQQTVHRPLQYRRMIAQLRRLAECLVNRPGQARLPGGRVRAGPSGCARIPPRRWPMCR